MIFGNHHDAWVNGADDPVSGNAALLETARGLAEISKQGWKPKRTILLASWDAEEWGLIGSTEWAEKHAEELRQKAVAYINTDSNSRGILRAGGSHSLERLLNDVARSIPDPETGQTLWERMRARALERAKSDEEKKKITGRADLRISALGSGSDYTVFVDHLGVASLNLGFSGEEGGGIYHSIYDSYDWYRRFGDPNFVYGRVLAQVTGTLLIRLADADLLPYEFTNLAETLATYLDEIDKLKPENVDVASLRPALDRMRASAEAFASRRDRAARLPASRLQELNTLLFRVERAALDMAGLPGRPWFRHQFYAPGVYTGYDVKTLPGLREAIEQKRWDEARQQLARVRTAFEAVAAEIAKAAALLE